MKKLSKRSFICLLALLLLCPAFAGCSGGEGESQEKEILFDEPVTFTVMTYEHQSQPVDPSAIKFQAIQEATNVTLDFDITPLAEYNTKKAAAFGSGILCDITNATSDDLSRFSGANIFMPLPDELLEESVPNFYQRVKDDLNWKMTKINGQALGFTTLNASTENVLLGGYLPVIRYDILEKNNLQMPTTWDEWFVVMKQLKTIYPDSTPFSGRNKGANMLTHPSFSMGCPPGLYFDYDTNQYSIGALETQYREILQFFVRCYEEGILDPNWQTVDSNTWDQGVTNNKIFFWYDNAGFAAGQTANLQKSDPEAKMQVMPLMVNSQGEKQGVLYNQHSYTAFWALSANAAEPEKLLKFMNWLYSDEGMYICNYGKEGETFNRTEDGKVTIPAEIIDKYRGSSSPDYNWMADYGLGLLCFTPLVNTSYGMSVQLGLLDEELGSIVDADYEAGYYHFEDIKPPLPEADRATVNNEMRQINALIFAGVNEFVEGTRPLTEYDNWVSDIKAAGAEHVLEVYNTALANAQ